MGKISKQAMILAAGYGKRMMPLTKIVPKPLVKVKKKPILHHLIDKLIKYGINEITINLHHLHHKIENLLIDNTFNLKINTIIEENLLETGGGVLNAIRKEKIGHNGRPFFVINGDILWIDGGKKSIFDKMEDFWDSNKMDILIVLIEREKLFGYEGNGDFNFLDNDSFFGNICKSKHKCKYVFSGLQLVNPHLFQGNLKKIFSLNEIFDSLIKKKKIFGLLDENRWFHIGTLKHLKRVEEFF